MKRLLSTALAAGILATSAMSAFAATGAPSGAHYTLNIIGVPKEKIASMTGSNRHSIFVPLAGSARIDLTQGEFAVLDGNGTDGRALFQLPAPDPDGDGWTRYSVYARALGKPGGSSKTTTCIQDVDGTYCSVEQMILVRAGGKSSFTNVSKQLLTACIDTTGDGKCDGRSSLFSDATANYYWQYDNAGLKLAQLRFYEVPSNVGTAP